MTASSEVLPMKPFAVRVTPLSVRAVRTLAPYTAMSFATFIEARDYCRHKISYTGDRVKRVEIVEHGNGTRAVWDYDWDAQSKHAGLWRE
jgi:hypothetical protein